MANITQAAVNLYKAQSDRIASGRDFSAAFKPIQDSVDNMLRVSEEAVDTFIGNLPEDYNLELVSDSDRIGLSTFLKEQKADYVALANIAGNLANNTSNPDCIRAVQEMQDIKVSMNKNVEDMVTRQTLRKFEIENKGNWNSLTDRAKAQAHALILNNEEIEFTNEGAFYKNPVTGESTRFSQLKKSDVVDYDLGNYIVNTMEGNVSSKKKGTPRGVVASSNRNTYAKMFSTPSAIRQAAFMGLPGDYLGETRYIDHYIAEQAILNSPGFEGINVIDINGDGSITDADKVEGTYQFEDLNAVEAKVKELKESGDLDISNDIIKFFTDLSMQYYDNTIIKTDESSSSGSDSPLDYSGFVKRIKSGVVTGIPSNDAKFNYQFIKQVSPGRYQVTNQNGAPLNFPQMSVEEVGAYVGLPDKYLRELLGVQVTPYAPNYDPLDPNN